MKPNLDDQASSLRDLVKDREDKDQKEKGLPPRSAIHQKKRKREKRKKIHLISVLLVVFLFIVIVILFFPFWGDSLLTSKLPDQQQNIPIEQVYLNENNKVEFQEGVYHTVTSDDTLFSIAQQYYNDKEKVELIILANDIQDNTIVVGTRLFIPVAKK
ncbi:LysM domain-containing protein [Gracilibacillus ureilyticus]|uniref:LysM domain-containing protein n=1 Tax=Gracilibacillus ureilyticus TaxID=531814 RepID=A0A1H9LRL2_9BACI|nr:LysM peptidoglycan-binding domain-containing protein [Gracilibacillus ureilyticus]SER14064.1 LysM domain-containing protein [Gracilibacillus ureilyticus]